MGTGRVLAMMERKKVEKMYTARLPVGTGRVLAMIERKKVEKMYTARFTNIDCINSSSRAKHDPDWGKK